MTKSLLLSCLALFLNFGLLTNVSATSDSDELSQIASLTVSLDHQFAANSIVTAELADDALKQSTAAQTRLQNWFVHAERACYDKFFVNDCLSEVKHRRREHNLILQRISLEAKAEHRKLHIEQLDKELAERQAKP